MYLVPKTVFFYEGAAQTKVLNELTSVGIKGEPYMEMLHTVLPLEAPDARGDWVYLGGSMSPVSNEPQAGFELLSVTGNTAYWRHPVGGVFSTSGVMAAKLLRFGDVSRMKLSLVFLDSSVASSLYGLIPEEQLELLGDKGALFDDIYFATQPDTLTVGTWYISEHGKVLYVGRTEEKLVFYKKKPSMDAGEFCIFCVSKAAWQVSSLPGTSLRSVLKANARYLNRPVVKDVPYLIKCEDTLTEDETAILFRYFDWYAKKENEFCTFEHCVAHLVQGSIYQDNVRNLLTFLSKTELELFMRLEPNHYDVFLKADKKVKLVLDWYFTLELKLDVDLQGVFCKEGWTSFNVRKAEFETTALNLEGICRAMANLNVSF